MVQGVLYPIQEIFQDNLNVSVDLQEKGQAPHDFNKRIIAHDAQYGIGDPMDIVNLLEDRKILKRRPLKIEEILAGKFIERDGTKDERKQETLCFPFRLVVGDDLVHHAQIDHVHDDGSVDQEEEIEAESVEAMDDVCQQEREEGAIAVEIDDWGKLTIQGDHTVGTEIQGERTERRGKDDPPVRDAVYKIPSIERPLAKHSRHRDRKSVV